MGEIAGLHFDATIRAGDILTLVGFVCVAFGVLSNIKTTLKLFGFRLDLIDASIEDLKTTSDNDKLHALRINRLEADAVMMRQDIKDMQVGEGFKQRRVSGLYTHTGKVQEAD